MKKLVALSAFIVLGFAAAYAQNPSKVAPRTTSATPVAAASVKAEGSDATVSKAGAKKECSADEKKACGSKASGKKSCCSSKAEAKKD